MLRARRGRQHRRPAGAVGGAVGGARTGQRCRSVPGTCSIADPEPSYFPEVDLESARRRELAASLPIRCGSVLESYRLGAFLVSSWPPRCPPEVVASRDATASGGLRCCTRSRADRPAARNRWRPGAALGIRQARGRLRHSHVWRWLVRGSAIVRCSQEPGHPFALTCVVSVGYSGSPCPCIRVRTSVNRDQCRRHRQPVARVGCERLPSP